MNQRSFVRLPYATAILVIIPFLTAVRFASTAYWSPPYGPYWLSEELTFRYIFWVGTVLALAWCWFSVRHLKTSLYLGLSCSLICAYRAVTIYPTRSSFGNVAFVAAVNWVTFAVICMVAVIGSLQFLMISNELARYRNGDQSLIGQRVDAMIQEVEASEQDDDT